VRDLCGKHLVTAGTNRLVFVGFKGMVIALDRASGRELWQAPLKGG
jgi:hypothetical protein